MPIGIGPPTTAVTFIGVIVALANVDTVNANPPVLHIKVLLTLWLTLTT